jgi:hypothetical protein
LSFGRAHLRHDVFHAVARLANQARFATLGIALLGYIARQPLILDHDEVITRIRHARQTKHLHRNGWASTLHLLAGFIEQRTHAPVLHAAHQVIAFAERALLHQYSGDRTATLVQRRLDHHAGSTAFMSGLEFEHFGLQQQCVEQVVHALPGFCR